MLFKQDIVNQLAKIEHNSAINQVRQKRSLVVDATQASLEALLSSDITAITIEERAYAAIFTAQLIKQPLLSDFFLAQFNSLNDTTIHLIKNDDIEMILDHRLKQILLFTQMVTSSPVNSNEQELANLQRVGLTSEAIVVLAQLIGFINYQARLLAGLSALNTYAHSIENKTI